MKDLCTTIGERLNVKRHLATAMGPNPQFLFWQRLLETVLFEKSVRRLLQSAEGSYPVIAIQNAQAVGKPMAIGGPWNTRFFNK